MSVKFDFEFGVFYLATLC